jgi:hypothetical protein
VHIYWNLVKRLLRLWAWDWLDFAGLLQLLIFFVWKSNWLCVIHQIIYLLHFIEFLAVVNKDIGIFNFCFELSHCLNHGLVYLTIVLSLHFCNVVC